jgi:hypothetical protein
MGKTRKQIPPCPPCLPSHKWHTAGIAKAELTIHFSINTDFTISLQMVEKTYK